MRQLRTKQVRLMRKGSVQSTRARSSKNNLPLATNHACADPAPEAFERRLSFTRQGLKHTPCVALLIALRHVPSPTFLQRPPPASPALLYFEARPPHASPALLYPAPACSLVS